MRQASIDLQPPGLCRIPFGTRLRIQQLATQTSSSSRWLQKSHRARSDLCRGCLAWREPLQGYPMPWSLPQLQLLDSQLATCSGAGKAEALLDAPKTTGGAWRGDGGVQPHHDVGQGSTAC